ncbi:MAG: helix-turn-helix domain-containing protein, partial [Pseudonocardia sp.]
ALTRECDNARTPALSSLALPRLTGREAEVAGLARQGMHNRAIAARLVVSVRTVEAHLANAYSKLGITSRKQLADALLLSRLGNRSAPDNRTGGDIQAAVAVPAQTRHSREFSTSGATAWLPN